MASAKTRPVPTTTASAKIQPIAVETTFAKSTNHTAIAPKIVPCSAGMGVVLLVSPQLTAQGIVKTVAMANAMAGRTVPTAIKIVASVAAMARVNQQKMKIVTIAGLIANVPTTKLV